MQEIQHQGRPYHVIVFDKVGCQDEKQNPGEYICRMECSNAHAPSKYAKNDAQEEHENGRQCSDDQQRRYILGVCANRKQAQAQRKKGQ